MGKTGSAGSPGTHASPISDYFAATRRPIYSILASAPFFIAYELGVIFLLSKQPAADRTLNKAAVVLQVLGSLLGQHAAYILPVAVGMALLFFLHWKERQASSRKGVPAPGLRLRYLPWMYAESLLLSLPLHLLLNEMDRGLALSAAGGQNSRGWLFQITTFCGAGAYEELLFRLFMFTGFFWMARALKLEKLPAWILAAAVSSVVFAVFHNEGNPLSPAFSPIFFGFAMIAGIYLAAICHFRSFGTAVATHASYDIMAPLMAFFHG